MWCDGCKKMIKPAQFPFLDLLSDRPAARDTYTPARPGSSHRSLIPTRQTPGSPSQAEAAWWPAWTTWWCLWKEPGGSGQQRSRREKWALRRWRSCCCCCCCRRRPLWSLFWSFSLWKWDVPQSKCLGKHQAAVSVFAVMLLRQLTTEHHVTTRLPLSAKLWSQSELRSVVLVCEPNQNPSKAAVGAEDRFTFGFGGMCQRRTLTVRV